MSVIIRAILWTRKLRHQVTLLKVKKLISGGAQDLNLGSLTVEVTLYIDLQNSNMIIIQSL